jgi:hypothetical protein
MNCNLVAKWFFGPLSFFFFFFLQFCLHNLRPLLADHGNLPVAQPNRPTKKKKMQSDEPDMKERKAGGRDPITPASKRQPERAVAIVGGRDFSDYPLMVERADAMHPTRVVSGGASGADSLAARYARERGLPLVELHADWRRWGKSAGLRRNVDIVQQADIVLAFWDGASRGTAHTIRTARGAGKTCIVVRYDRHPQPKGAEL